MDEDLQNALIEKRANEVKNSLIEQVNLYCELYQACRTIEEKPKPKPKPNINKMIIAKMQKASYGANIYNKKILKKKGKNKWDSYRELAEYLTT